MLQVFISIGNEKVLELQVFKRRNMRQMREKRRLAVKTSTNQEPCSSIAHHVTTYLWKILPGTFPPDDRLSSEVVVAASVVSPHRSIRLESAEGRVLASTRVTGCGKLPGCKSLR